MRALAACGLALLLSISAAAPHLAAGPSPAAPLAVGASGQNSNIQLTVTTLQMVASAGSMAAPPGHQYAVVTTVWKNLVAPKTVERPKSGPAGVKGEKETVTVETPYLVPDLSKNLYLFIDGRRAAEISQATRYLPDRLPLPLSVAHYNDEVRGTVAFFVPVAAFQNLSLQFYDFKQGHITLSLYGSPATVQDKPMAGPARNQVLEAGVYRTEFTRQAGPATPPAGSRYLMVDLGMTSLSAGNVVQVDLNQFAFLIEDGVYQYRAAKELAGFPYQFYGTVNVLPGFLRRGVVVFVVPEQTGRLELLIAAARVEPLAFVLTPDVAAKAQPRPLRSIQDGDVAEIMLNAASAADRLGDAAAAAGRRFLVLDVTALNKDGRRGVIIQPVQFTLTDGQRTFTQSAATAKLLRGLVAERVIPAGGRGRFEIAFEVPTDAQGLRLKYQGFTKIEEVPLP